MSLRNASGKFSLAGFGRKASGVDRPGSPSRDYASGGTDEEASPVRESHGAGAGFDGLGRKLKGSLAHNGLLPALGHKDLRALQDIITSEKGVLLMAEKLSAETLKASSCLVPYGQQEGPDLQDILSQSSVLLNHLSSALTSFASHQADMRSSLKKIRLREEGLMELKSNRKSTGTKAENAERKLAKMGPENKGLPTQTELLERLRSEMRSMDQDISTEETKIGDFKRQTLKEALSLKFGGLEELGEKMCIIGELGKLLLEEVPLEETPVGYGRAPYSGYDKTDNAVKEATKCLATVQFHAASTNPKPPGLPQPPFSAPLRTPSIPHDERSIATHAEYGDYPAHNLQGGDGKGKQRESYPLDAADASPYGGIESNPYALPSTSVGGQDVYPEYGANDGTAQGGHIMFQSPISPPIHTTLPLHSPEEELGYEYEQQRQMDAEANQAGTESEDPWRKLEAEEAAWNQDAGTAEVVLPNPHDQSEGAKGQAPWQPLKINSRTPEPTSVSLHDGPSASLPPTNSSSDLLPPAMPGVRPGTVTPGAGDFHTPLGSPSMDQLEAFPSAPAVNPESSARGYAPGLAPIIPPSITPPQSQTQQDSPYSPANMGTGGKISAAAFRKGTKQPKASLGPEDVGSPGEGEYGSVGGNGVRRLPVPPIGAGGYEGDGKLSPPPPGYQSEESLR